MDNFLKSCNAVNNRLGNIVDELDTTQETMKQKIQK